MEKQMSIPTSEALRATGKAQVAVQAKAVGRLLFIDNIRIFLTILVLLHHLMIIYADTGSWMYKEGLQDTITNALGSWFCSTNQAYFMGLFLLVSAYFVPGSYDRKGAGRFLKDRLIRLGIPLAIYSWVIRPLFLYGFWVWTEGPMPFNLDYYRAYFTGGAILGDGPLWFIETLLIFTILYAIWRWLVRSRPEKPASERPFPRDRSIVLFALLMGVAAFLIRLWLPVGWSFKPLNLQFPFFAQYIALFVVGLVAYRNNWLMALPDRTGRHWLAISALLILAFPVMALAGGAVEDDTFFRGGWHWQSLAYALWESFLCLSMCVGVIYVFRRFGNRQGKIARFLSPNAYTAYLIHEPVIVSVAVAASGVMLYPLLKWGVVALIAVPLSFGLSALIRKLPYTERVL